MRKNRTAIFLLLVSISAFAQKKNDNNIIISPTNAKIVSIYEDKIKKQIIADWKDAIDFTLEKNNGISRKYLLDSTKRETYKSENPRVGVFFLSKQELIDLLYGKNEIEGFHLFFTKYNNEIVLTNADSKLRILNPDFKLLQATKNPLKSVKNESLAQIRDTFPYKNKIRSYFIGRHCMMLNLTDRLGKIDATVSGIQLDVRESNKHEYSVIFTLIRTNKSTEYIGVATFKASETTTINGQVVNVETVGGSAGSRPCPTACPE